MSGQILRSDWLVLEVSGGVRGCLEVSGGVWRRLEPKMAESEKSLRA